MSIREDFSPCVNKRSLMFFDDYVKCKIENSEKFLEVFDVALEILFKIGYK